MTKEKFLIDDSEFTQSKFSLVCSFCVNFDLESSLGEKRTCRAFPEGIPNKIWKGENNHRRPFQGDNGIQFELHPDAKVEPNA